MSTPICGRPKANGQPCGWMLNGAECPYHGDNATPESRRLLPLKGAIASRMRRALPATYQVPEFVSPDAIVAFARELARLALTADVDPRRIAEARGAASLALSAHQARAQQQLVDALIKLEGGGAALLLLQRLQAGVADGARRPLPSAGRVLPVPPADGEAS